MSEEIAGDRSVFARLAHLRNSQPLREVELPPETRRAYEGFGARAKDLITTAREAVTGLPEIYFDFIVNPEVNAFATNEGGRYFIGVNTGLVFLLRLLTGRMLSDGRLFPWVGDPSEVRKDGARIDFYVPHADQMWSSEKLLTPVNDIRQAYAAFIMDRALMFFVGHEIAHISRGHIAYALHVRGMPIFAEQSERLDATLLIERQCLELDADQRAVMALFDSMRKMQDSPDFKDLPWTDGPKDTASLFRDWAVVIAIVFRMLGDQKLSDVNLGKSYPPL